jgi:hypothetical protein
MHTILSNSSDLKIQFKKLKYLTVFKMVCTVAKNQGTLVAFDENNNFVISQNTFA